MAQLQAVLAAAHRYQVARLLRWTEAQLCELIGAETVCSLLSMAQLYGGAELERHCLEYMNGHLDKVTSRPEFEALPSPTLVKLYKFQVGLPESKKRKRGD